MADFFKNPRQVFLYLQGLGCKVSQATVYNKINDGTIKGRRGGGFSPATVDAYAATLPNENHAESGPRGDAPAPVQSQGKEVVLAHCASSILAMLRDGRAGEQEILELLRPLTETASAMDLRNAYDAIHKREQARNAELKRLRAEGELAPWSAVEEVMVAKAAVLRSDLRNFAFNHAGELVFLVDGDAAKVAELQSWLQERLEEALHRYSSAREFEVLFTPGGDDAAVAVAD